MPPLVTIIGRPNVGKSTLFNRLIKDRRALVDGMPGVTRDRLYGEFQHSGKTFRLADTGGLDLEDPDNIISGIRDQAISALNEADLALFVVDVRGGLSPIEEEIASYLRKYDKLIILALNKVDSAKQNVPAQEFLSLGFDHTVMVSAEHGRGMDELLDTIAELLSDYEEEASAVDRGMSVAIIGRPNVGKSSLLNALIGESRTIVSEAAGTTRDVIDVTVSLDGQNFTFLDTAGIRKKAAITARMEAVSSIKARQSIERADCTILVLDASIGVTAQDKALAGMIDKDGSGAVIAFNKWDLMLEKLTSGEEGDRLIRRVRKDIKSLPYAPIVSTCALSGQRVPKLVEQLVRIAALQQRIIPAGELTHFIENLQRFKPIPMYRGKPVEIYRMTQTTAAPARFRLFTRGYIPDNYLKFIENRLRGAFDLEGIPARFMIVRV